MKAFTAGIVGVVCLAQAATAAAQRCPSGKEVRLGQETYAALNTRVFVYADRIEPSGSSGWKPFSVRVLTGEYRRPFLLSKGFMREADLRKLLGGRSDITQTVLVVEGAGPRWRPGAATVSDRGQPITIQVARVEPPGRGGGAVVLSVCGI